MAINITISNSLEKLAEKFKNRIAQQDGDIFRKEVIVTQTKGVEKWLSLYVAKNSENGIFANFEYENPNGFIDKYLLKNLDNSYEDSFYHPGNMKWEIFNILKSDLINDIDFTQIKAYILGNEVKALRLSNILADLFDQYFIYRPNMIHAWKTGEIYDKILDPKYVDIQKWQKKIFIELLKSNNKKNEYRKDRVELKDQFLDEFDPSFLTKFNNVKRVSFFGLSIITQYHYEIIDKLSEHFECDFYLLNPSGEFWYDIISEKSVLSKIMKGEQDITDKSDNDFLANYSRSGQEFYKILFSNDQVLDNIDDEDFDYTFKNDLLGFVQASIFNIDPIEDVNKTRAQELLGLNDNGTPKEYNPTKPFSVTSCFTPFREVEVLYDHLCAMFDKDKNLKPSDIVVMLPDIESYAPYIEAVFSQRVGGKAIPFSIADKSHKGSDSVFDVIAQIVNLNRGSFEAEQIMSIVENRFIAKKYGFEDFEKIREIINVANIRWGVDEKQISKDGDFEYNKFNSWEFGLKRIILGYAMQTEGEAYDTLPIDIVEGAEALDGLRLYKLINDIKWFFKHESRVISLLDWAKFFKEQFFDRFISLEFDEINMKQDFDALFLNFRSETIKVNFKIVQDEFLSLYSAAKSEQGFYSGKVTFCSMIPMRSIPHKIVAMLGMAENAFPGRKTKITFDLIDANRVLGDRDTKLSNRYLFLEAMVSAKNYLYLSYVGKSAKNSSTLNPSAAIDDLISYIAEILKVDDDTAKKALVAEFPLYGYGEKYRDATFTTYIADNDISERRTVIMDQNSNETPAYVCNTVLSIINFFKDAPKWYCNVILGVYFNEDEILLRGEESFDVNGLVKWEINSELVGKNNETNIVENYQKYRGDIPVGSMGEVFVENREKELEELTRKFQSYSSNREKIDSDLLYNNIEGSVTIYKDIFVSFSVSSTHYKAYIEHYINHLFLCAKSLLSESVFINKSGEETIFKILETEEAKERIDELVNFIEAHSTEPIAFDIETATSFVSKPDKLDIKSLNKLLNNRRINKFGKGDYLNKLLPTFSYDDEQYENFISICDLLKL